MAGKWHLDINKDSQDWFEETLLNGNEGEYLFDMSLGSNHEKTNLINNNSELVKELRDELESWVSTFQRNPYLSTSTPSSVEKQWYDYHLAD